MGHWTRTNMNGMNECDWNPIRLGEDGYKLEWKHNLLWGGSDNKIPPYDLNENGKTKRKKGVLLLFSPTHFHNHSHSDTAMRGLIRWKPSHDATRLKLDSAYGEWWMKWTNRLPSRIASQTHTHTKTFSRKMKQLSRMLLCWNTKASKVYIETVKQLK